MLRPIHGWIALAALWAGAAAAAPPSPPQLTEADEAAVEGCLLQDEAAIAACLTELDLPLPPELAELLEMAGDAGRYAEYTRWQQGFDAAMLAQARTLAARGDARSLLAAVLIAPVEYEGSNGGPRPVPGEVRGWFDAARVVRPADPLVAWWEANGCLMPAQPCDAAVAVARLLQVDGDNAIAHWQALNAALDGDDDIAARTHLRLAAQAPRFEPYADDLLALLLEARDGAPLAPMDAISAKAAGLAQQLGRPATSADFIATISSAQWAALSPALGSGMMQLCGPDRPARDAALRQDCIALLAKVADDESTVLHPAIALPALIKLTSGPQQAAWQARLREHAWMYEQYTALLVGGPGAPAEFPRWIAADGEIAAIRELMRRRGIPIEPPADWLPRHPTSRALITTGRAPVD